MVVRLASTRLITVLVILLLAAALAVEAQEAGQSLHTVGVLTPHSRHREYPAFLETLRRLGYDQDRNLRLLFRSAEDKLERLPKLATELVEARVEVIVAINT